MTRAEKGAFIELARTTKENVDNIYTVCKMLLDRIDELEKRVKELEDTSLQKRP